MFSNPNIEYKEFDKHATNLWHIMQLLQKDLLTNIRFWEHYIADGIPLPTCHLSRSKQSSLFKTKVAKHYCTAKNEHYYGFKLLLVTTESGIPIDYVFGKANTDERELLKDVDLPMKSTINFDRGFISKTFTLYLQKIWNRYQSVN